MDTLVVVLALATLAVLFILLAYKMVRSMFQMENQQYISVTNLSAARKYYTSNKDMQLSLIYVSVKLDEMSDMYPNDMVTDAYTKVGCLLLNMVKNNAGNMVAGIDDKDFLIVSVSADKNFKALCDKFYDELSLYGEKHKLQKLPVVSFGMYAPRNARISFEEALMNAKQTYRYAASKKQRYTACNYDMLCEFEEKEHLEQYIENSIKNDGFHIMLQPYINLKTGQTIGCEILARLKHPICGMVMPETFIEVIDKKGLNISFDYSIFNKCCEWLASRPDEMMDGRTIACNFSRQTLSCSDFVEQVKSIADKYGVKYDRIAIEITEHTKENNADAVLSNTIGLHKLGFKIFLDDYGTGVSTYSDIRNYPIDMLKIDKEFLYNCNTEAGKTVFENIVELAKRLDIPVLCEGVETKEQEDYVKQTGCDIAQGFYYYMPMEAYECTKLFRENITK